MQVSEDLRKYFLISFVCFRVLCETIKDFTFRLAQTSLAQGDDHFSEKCQVLNTKLDMLVQILDQEGAGRCKKVKEQEEKSEENEEEDEDEDEDAEKSAREKQEKDINNLREKAVSNVLLKIIGNPFVVEFH